MKRHNTSEITLKLRQADEMAFGGQNQAQICKNLGVSVMTLHRWRKLYAGQAGQPDSLHDGEDRKNPASVESSFIQELMSENRRLRKIVADLLLEKAKLEEAAQHVGPEDAAAGVNVGAQPKLF